MEWDTALLNAWRADVKVKALMMQFCSPRNLDFAAMRQKLKRIPPQAWWHKPVQAFVAACLPYLSKRLWDGPYTTAELVLWMDEVSLSVQKPRAARDRGERRYAVAKDNRTRRVDMHAGHRRADWAVCK